MPRPSTHCLEGEPPFAASPLRFGARGKAAASLYAK